MYILKNLLKISLIGIVTLVPYTTIRGYAIQEMTKISTSNEVAILGTQRREERRDDRQERRDDRQGTDDSYDYALPSETSQTQMQSLDPVNRGINRGLGR